MGAIPEWIRTGLAMGAVFSAGFGASVAVKAYSVAPEEVAALRSDVDELKALIKDRRLTETNTVRIELVEEALCAPEIIEIGGPVRERYCEVVRTIAKYGIGTPRPPLATQ